MHVRSVLSPAEVATYRDAAAAAYASMESLTSSDVFKQIVQVWRRDDTLRRLTMNPRIAAIASRLAGVDLRLWHDHLLIKKPHNGAPTEFHQDAPYWPLSNVRHCLSAWIALVDVPVERGCMTFLPGTHERHDIRPVDLEDATDMFTAAPDLAYEPRVTVPLRAGDCTFHNGYLAHSANPNATDEFRYAHVVIYTDALSTYDGKPHVVTDPLGLSPVSSCRTTCPAAPGLSRPHAEGAGHRRPRSLPRARRLRAKSNSQSDKRFLRPGVLGVRDVGCGPEVVGVAVQQHAEQVLVACGVGLVTQQDDIRRLLRVSHVEHG